MDTKIKRIVYVALFSAMFVIFGKFVTFDFTVPGVTSMKIAIKSLPLYVGAITFGPIAGAFIGLVGELVLQLTGQYGFTATTLFWVIPYVIVGIICGIAFENKFVKLNGEIKYWLFIIALQVILTLLNTVAILIDSIIFGYYTFIYVYGSLIVRLMSSILAGMMYCVVISFIINAIKKIH